MAAFFCCIAKRLWVLGYEASVGVTLVVPRHCFNSFHFFWSCICSTSTAVKIPMVDPTLRVKGWSVRLRYLAIIWPLVWGWFRLVGMGRISEWYSIKTRRQKSQAVTRHDRVILALMRITT